MSKSDRESDWPCALLQRRKRFKAAEHLMRRQLKPEARRQGLITASGAGAAARSCPRAYAWPPLECVARLSPLNLAPSASSPSLCSVETYRGRLWERKVLRDGSSGNVLLTAQAWGLRRRHWQLRDHKGARAGAGVLRSSS